MSWLLDCWLCLFAGCGFLVVSGFGSLYLYCLMCLLIYYGCIEVVYCLWVSGRLGAAGGGLLVSLGCLLMLFVLLCALVHDCACFWWFCSFVTCGLDWLCVVVVFSLVVRCCVGCWLDV